MTTRTQVAQYLSQNLHGSNRSKAINQVAAWLVKTGKRRQATYVGRDVAFAALDSKGYVAATVTSARPLSPEAQKAVEIYLKKACKASEVELELLIDPSVIGGVRIDTPVGTLDETVKQRLMTIVRGNNE